MWPKKMQQNYGGGFHVCLAFYSKKINNKVHTALFPHNLGIPCAPCVL